MPTQAIPDRSSEIISPRRASSVVRLIILWWQFVINVSYQGDAHLSRVVPPQDVTDKVGLHLHLNHLEGAAKDAAENI